MELIPGLPDDVGLECLVRISQENFSSVASVCRKWKNTIHLLEFWLLRKAANLAQKIVVFSQARVGDLVIGGWDPATWEVSNDVFVYDFVSAKWKRGAPMTGCRRSFFACASDNRRFVLVAGGHNTEKSALKSPMSYDLTEDLWVTLPEMEQERDESAGVFHCQVLCCRRIRHKHARQIRDKR